MKTLWLFDLDETIFDNKHREHHVKKDVPDWEAFHAYEEVIKDTPMPWTAGLWDANGTFRYGEHGFLTARSPRCQDVTRDCLVKHGFFHKDCELHMKTPEHEAGVHFKALKLLELLAESLGRQIVFCEDQPRIIQTLRALEHPRLTVLDVNDEAFLTRVHYYGTFALEERTLARFP